MKKRLVLFIFMILVSSCRIDFNGPLRRKMLNYYSNDNNYVKLIGVVKSIGDYQYEKIKFEIELQEKDKYPMYDHNTEGYHLFAVYSLSELSIDLKYDDEINFTTSLFYFYNGHRLPIVAIEKKW